MANTARRRARDPEATRADILEAALSLLSRDGIEAVSLSAVAALAGVNRGTAYQHFESRENLVTEALDLMSNRMFHAVFGEPESVEGRDVANVDMVQTTQRLSDFAMENADLCRVWLTRLLSMPDPNRDPFWREYAGSIGRFAATEMAKPGIDVEAFSVMTLAGSFLWPIWAQSKSRNESERDRLSQRFVREMLRLSLHGTLNEEHVPDVVEKLADDDFGRRTPSLSLVKQEFKQGTVT